MMKAKRLAISTLLIAAAASFGGSCMADTRDPEVARVVARGLEWLAAHQSGQGSPSGLGRWTANDGRYPAAMTAMAGIALLCEGSTTTQGRYSPNIRRAVDYLLSQSQPNGLIGDPNQIILKWRLIKETTEIQFFHFKRNLKPPEKERWYGPSSPRGRGQGLLSCL